jgi:LemA protein
VRYGLIAAAAVVLLISVLIVLAFNGLVRRRNHIDNAWAQVDVQLRRRYDLIPNLVATVQGYATHERSTLEAVTAARAWALQAVAGGSRAELAQAEDYLAGALRGLFGLAEAYPDLKANGNFLQLQNELVHTEDRAAYARQYFNDAVLAYNNAVGTFPRSLVAGAFGFRIREYFRTDGAASGPVTVRF